MLFVGLLALHVTTVRIACLGPGSDSLTGQLSRLLGEGYDVQAFSDPKLVAGFDPSYLVLEPIASSTVGGSYDTVVPSLKKTISSFTSLPGHPKIYLCVDSSSSEVDQVYRRPLTIQAARESGAQTVEGEDDSAKAQQLFGLVFDWKTEKAGWSVVSSDSEQVDDGPAKGAIDGDPNTYWHTQYDPKVVKYPHEIVVDMGSVRSLGGFRYLPRQDGGVNGRVKNYEYLVSVDGQSWGAPVATGKFENSMSPSIVRLAAPVQARYFKFKALSEQNGQPYASAAELDVLPANFAHS